MRWISCRSCFSVSNANQRSTRLIQDAGATPLSAASIGVREASASRIDDLGPTHAPVSPPRALLLPSEGGWAVGLPGLLDVLVAGAAPESGQGRRTGHQGLDRVGGGARTTMHGFINGAGLNPGGNTSIGDGIFEGRGTLSGATAQVQSLVVLTDGNENRTLGSPTSPTRSTRTPTRSASAPRPTPARRRWRRSPATTGATC
jgi:hypothetical protein